MDESGFNQNMHRSRGRAEIGQPCRIESEPKGPNISILGVISQDGVFALSKREVSAAKPAKKQKRTRDESAADKSDKKGTMGDDFFEIVEHVLACINLQGIKYKYLVLDNCPIHMVTLLNLWVMECDVELLFMPPYSPFLNPIKEF